MNIRTGDTFVNRHKRVIRVLSISIFVGDETNNEVYTQIDYSIDGKGNFRDRPLVFSRLIK